MLTRKMSSATPTDLLDVVWSREFLPSMSDCGTEGNPNFTKPISMSSINFTMPQL